MTTTKAVYGGGVLIVGLILAVCWKRSTDQEHKSLLAPPTEPTPKYQSRRDEYAGSQSCKECHQSHFDRYINTSHYHTSSSPEEGLVKGSFSGERSVFDVRPDYRMVMRKESGKHRQYIQADGFDPFHQDIDVVIGAGVYAQAFAGWEGSKLVRLQAHYLTPADQWTLNPGTDAEVTRLLISNRCMECHATYFEPDPDNPEFTETYRSIRHNRDNFMLKMHCEKCHGPGRAHVDYFKHPREGVDFKKLIVNPARLDRERQIQVCGLCHSGVGELLSPSFTYQPGDNLTEFIRFDQEELDAVGLHSNNIHFLKKSRCFQESPTMTCSTCHDPHRNQRGDLSSFSQQCLNCHETKHCPEERRIGPDIANNCIDCHMPKQPDNRFSYLINGTNYTFDLRTHWIKPYPKDEVDSPESPERR